MRRWWLWIALLLSAGLNLGLFSSLVIQRLRPPPPAPERGGLAAVRTGIERFADRLHLDDETRRAFVDRHEQYLDAAREPRLRLARLRTELRLELTAAEPDRAKTERLIDEAAATYAELERGIAGLVLDVRGMLEPGEQREYLRFLERLRFFVGQGQAPGRLGPRNRLRPRVR